MKKVLILTIGLISLSLSACSNQEKTTQTGLKENKQQLTTNKEKIKVTEDTQKIRKDKSIVSHEKEKQESVKENQNTNNQQEIQQVKNTISSQQNLEQQETKKWDQIVNSKSGLFFYKLDCKKLFKTKEFIKKCELAGLKEAGYSCLAKSYFGTDDINKIFNKQKFDLIDDTTINRYKQMCKKQLDEIKKQQQEEQKRQKKIEQVQQIIKNFKLSDCEKLADKQKFELPPKEILNKLPQEERERLLNAKQDFVKTCKIGVVLRYKNGDCSLLKKSGLDKECEKVKKDLNFYRRLQQEQRQYGRFDLMRFLAPDLVNQESMPGRF